MMHRRYDQYGPASRMSFRRARRARTDTSLEIILTKSVNPAAIGDAVLLEAAEQATARAARGWLLRMLRWGGGASNADLVVELLDRIGMRHSRRFVVEQGDWLASRGYLITRQFEMVIVYELTRIGDEVARAVVVDEGVGPIQLADVSADEVVIKSSRSH